MVKGVQYINNDIFFTRFKKHYCPTCNEKLSLVKKSKIVNSKSPEAKNYDFYIGNGYVSGDVKFVWKDFKCPICEKEFTVSEMKQFEKKQKKKAKKAKRLEKEQKKLDRQQKKAE